MNQMHHRLTNDDNPASELSRETQMGQNHSENVDASSTSVKLTTMFCYLTKQLDVYIGLYQLRTCL